MRAGVELVGLPASDGEGSREFSAFFSDQHQRNVERIPGIALTGRPGSTSHPTGP
jgi:hypothetical protein